MPKKGNSYISAKKNEKLAYFVCFIVESNKNDVRQRIEMSNFCGARTNWLEAVEILDLIRYNMTVYAYWEMRICV